MKINKKFVKRKYFGINFAIVQFLIMNILKETLLRYLSARLFAPLEPGERTVSQVMKELPVGFGVLFPIATASLMEEVERAAPLCGVRESYLLVKSA